MAVLNYLEVPIGTSDALEAQKAFYVESFGWNFTEYGPEYAAHEDGPCQFAFNAVEAREGRRTAAMLPLVRVDDIESARNQVVAAGGRITEEIFDFPGGRRFHFTDPAGQELGCYQPG